MVNVSIARRYARALLSAADTQADAVLKQLEGFVALLSSSTELTDVVENPAYTRAQKMAVVEALVTATGGTHPQLSNLLRLLTDRARIQHLADIARLYRDLVDQKLGRVRGKVTSAAPLPADQLLKLSQALKALTQREVLIEAKVDQKLLGGVTAQVGSTLFDGSLRSQLDELGRSLSARR